MLPKEQRLKSKEDFQQVCTKGKFSSQGLITIRFLPNGVDKNRIGFAVGKKYSKKAVERNRTKRIMQAAAGSLVDKLVPGFDLVINIRKPLPGQSVDAAAISAAINFILKKNNLLK